MAVQTKFVYVDVDGTLIKDGRVNHRVVEFITEIACEVIKVVVWSQRGEAYARYCVEHAGLRRHVSYCLAKPHFLIDDMGWNWVKGVPVLLNYNDSVSQVKSEEPLAAKLED